MTENEHIAIKSTPQQDLELVERKSSLVNQMKTQLNEAENEWDEVTENYNRIYTIYDDQKKLYKMRATYIKASSGRKALLQNMDTRLLFNEIDQKRIHLEQLNRVFTIKLDRTEGHFQKLMDLQKKHVYSVMATLQQVIKAQTMKDVTNIEIPTIHCSQDELSTELDLRLHEWQQLDLVRKYSLEMQRLIK